MVLQQLLEDVTGRAFAEMVRELVFSPAQMTTAR
jgi:CubicO group peptidase (beta-lactamase class C family)